MPAFCCGTGSRVSEVSNFDFWHRRGEGVAGQDAGVKRAARAVVRRPSTRGS
jgi:hypothetical protein